MSFRAKLLLTTLAIVATTTIATLWIVQRANADLHAMAVDQIFAAEIDAYLARQKQPLDAAAAQARSLAESVRLFAALEEGESEFLHATADDELRDANFAFYRFTDPQGNLIPPPEGAASGPAGIDTAIRAQLHATGESPDPIRLGFVAHEGAVYSVVSGAIAIPDQVAGFLLIGQRLDEVESPESALSSGLFVNGQLVSKTLPAGVTGELAERLREGRLTSGDTLMLDSQPHRVDLRPLNPGSVFAPAQRVSLYAMGEFRRRQRALTLRIAGIGGAGFLAAAVAATFIAGRLTRPVRDLVEGTDAIRRGDYGVRVARRTGDELGALADSFNEMAGGLALKERYRSVLSLVTDPTVADELLSGAVQLGGETREVTVVFCDIRGFTPLSQGMEPSAVVALLNEHMSALTSVVRAHRGVVDKFVGDEIMILFGAPKTHGDDAARAVRCAWEMIRRRRELDASGPRALAVGIGIASGPVLAGCMGSEDRLDYTVVGERVNLASRLCGQAGPMEIVIDAATRAALPPDFPLDIGAPESVQLKGFSGAVTAHRIRTEPS